MSKRKAYNPRKASTGIIPPYQLMPLIGPLDKLADLIKRGYLTDEEIMCNEDLLPSQYLLMSYLYQHTFLIEYLQSAQDKPIAKYLKSIRTVIEKYLIKVMHHAVQDCDMVIVPEKVTFGAIGAAKLIWFITHSKKALYGLRHDEYMKAVKESSTAHLLKLKLDPECPVRHFVNMDLSNKFIESF